MDRRAEIKATIRAALDGVDGDRTPLDLVGETPLLEAAVDEIVTERVEAARDQGLSWEAIAQSLGISRQAAHKRFGRRGTHRASRKSAARLELRIEQSERDK